MNKNILLISVCPTVLTLVLKNAAKDKYSRFEGSYLLSQSKVNGHQYWIQYAKSGAIWYGKNNFWVVTYESFIGKAQGLLWNPDSAAPCPHIGNWTFWDWHTTSWTTPNTSDIIFSTSGNYTILE